MSSLVREIAENWPDSEVVEGEVPPDFHSRNFVVGGSESGKRKAFVYYPIETIISWGFVTAEQARAAGFNV